MKRQLLATALLSISLAAGCSDDSGPTAPQPSTFPLTIHASVSAVSGSCQGTDELYGDVQFPCEAFPIVASRTGTLVARLTWTDRNNWLRLGAGSGNFFNWSSNCSSSHCEIRVPVAKGGTANLAVGLDRSRSRSTSQAFDVNVSLE